MKILDFGLALQRLDQPSSEGPTVAATAQGVVLGTFGYMSPEQVTGERVDGRQRHLRARLRAVRDADRDARCSLAARRRKSSRSLLHDSVPELVAFDPLAPAELRPILSRCVDRVTTRRFESAQDLAMALRALLTGSAAAGTAGSKRRAARGKSLAVLPFVNAGADPATRVSDRRHHRKHHQQPVAARRPARRAREASSFDTRVCKPIRRQLALRSMRGRS